MENKNLVVSNYKKFCELDGSNYIASEFALETILKIIRIFNVNDILELGLGIGSISDTVLQYSENEQKKIRYVGTENNSFCLNALSNNVNDFKNIELYAGLNQVKNDKFDLIIIDGYDDTLKEVVAFCKKNTIIYIEGDRKSQTDTIRQIFPYHKYVNIITLKKNKPYSHNGGNTNHYVGGGQLIFIDPTFKMKLFWFQQKVVTSIIYKLRTIR